MEMSKKGSMPKCQELSIRYHFFIVFVHGNVKKKLDTQMSRMKHPISFFYRFCPWKCLKKARYPNVTNEASDIIIIWIFFHGNAKNPEHPLLIRIKSLDFEAWRIKCWNWFFSLQNFKKTDKEQTSKSRNKSRKKSIENSRKHEKNRTKPKKHKTQESGMQQSS